MNKLTNTIESSRTIEELRNQIKETKTYHGEKKYLLYKSKSNNSITFTVINNKLINNILNSFELKYLLMPAEHRDSFELVTTWTNYKLIHRIVLIPIISMFAFWNLILFITMKALLNFSFYPIFLLTFAFIWYIRAKKPIKYLIKKESIKIKEELKLNI